jgi:hypothetical protein
VSSGAFVAAGLANGISPSEMHAMFMLDRSHRDPFEPIYCCVRRSASAPSGSCGWLARHGVAIDLTSLEDEERASSRPSQTGRLWDSVKPLEKTLGDLKKALSRDAPRT